MGRRWLRSAPGTGREIVDERIGPDGQPRGVDAMRRNTGVGETAGGAAKHGYRALGVTPLNVGDADRELGKALPEQPLILWTVLPCGLEHLVGVERQTPVQQILGIGQRCGRR